MRLPRWKKEKSQCQKHRLICGFKKIALAVLSIFFIVLIFAGFQFLSSSKIFLNNRVNFVLISNSFDLVSLEPQKEMVIVSIPQDTLVEFPKGLGLKKLSEAKREMAASVIGELIGIPIDGWIVTTNNQLPTTNDKKKIISLKIFLKPTQTNFSLLDLVKIWWEAKSLRFDKIKTLTFNDSLDGLFKERKIIGEKITIEVLNGSGKPQMANRIAKMITNLGGQVVSVGNHQKIIDKCQLIGSKKTLESYLISRLQKALFCDKIVRDFEARADLQVIIGFDYYRKLFLK